MADLLGQNLDQKLSGNLAPSVEPPTRQRKSRIARTDIDDPPIVSHAASSLLEGKEGAFGVDREQSVKIRLREIIHGFGDQFYARVGDYDVEPTVRLKRCIKQSPNVAYAGDVRLDRSRVTAAANDIRRGLFGQSTVACIVQDNLGASGSVTLRDCTAYPSTGASYQRHFSIKTHDSSLDKIRFHRINTRRYQAHLRVYLGKYVKYRIFRIFSALYPSLIAPNKRRSAIEGPFREKLHCKLLLDH
ncbi:hypothetical protein NL534_10470 [Mesorhizobium opportunistum]|nr:hypothetical protein [Mesorhizobium opportunistum]WJI40635.1 hypothetical protein NL534_10470 [Mesorhizobium opportunistum]